MPAAAIVAIGSRPLLRATTRALLANGPRLVPIHHTTFAHYREPIEALEELASACCAGRFQFAKVGQALPLSGQ